MKKNTFDSIVLYTDKRGNVELHADVKEETLWATQAQITQLFETTLQNVNLHLINIYKDNELKEKRTIKESLIVLKNGRKYLTKLYNLDAIIAVGYRINSKKATKFRIWATGILREYLTKGFNLDKRKLVASSNKLVDLHEAIKFIESKPEDGQLKAKITVRMTKDLIR